MKLEAKWRVGISFVPGWCWQGGGGEIGGSGAGALVGSIWSWVVPRVNNPTASHLETTSKRPAKHHKLTPRERVTKVIFGHFRSFEVV